MAATTRQQNPRNPKDAMTADKPMWTYEGVVASSVHAHRVLTSPQTWFAFYPLVQRLLDVDAAWPAVGSSITVAVGWARGPSARVHHTVVAHQPPRRSLLSEQALGGIWQDRPELVLSERGPGGTRILLMVRPSCRYRLLRPIVGRVSRLFDRSTKEAMRTLCRLIGETGDPSKSTERSP